jgi:hypothetical protein
MTTNSFITDTYNKVKEAINHFDENQLPDIYTISFFKSRVDDDPRKPMLQVGYNTISQWKACTPSPGQEIGWPIASDADEAKWNFAFWLQNEELIIGGEEYDPVTEWVKQLPFYYTDEQEEKDNDIIFELGGPIQKQFMDIMIAHAKRLYEEGVIRTKFGRDIPIIIHELEYYDVPLNWTKQANPEGLIKEFEDWINSL